MLYSSGSTTTFQAVKNILNSSSLISVQSRKIETSDPQELNEAFLKAELGLDANKESDTAVVGNSRAFAKPKGPLRRR